MTPPVGWIKLYRKVMDSGILKNHKLWAFWSWCMLKASHQEAEVVVGYQTVKLLPGQFVFGRKVAAAELNMSEQEIRTCLKFCTQIDKNLTIESTNKFSIITIVNWETYQGNGEADNQQDNQQLTSQQPATNQQLTTNKNVKKVKNVRSKEEDLKDAPSPEVQEAIAYFCDSVERKFSFKPKVTGADGKMVKDNLKYGLDHIKAQIDYYLTIRKSEEFIGLTAALSAHTYNGFMRYQNGGTNGRNTSGTGKTFGKAPETWNHGDGKPYPVDDVITE